MIQHTLIIIPVAIRAAVEQAIADSGAFPGRNPDGEFTVDLFAMDDVEEVTPTHSWISFPFTPGQRAAVSYLAGLFPSASVYDYTDPNAPSEILASLGLAVKRSTMLPDG